MAPLKQAAAVAPVPESTATISVVVPTLAPGRPAFAVEPRQAPSGWPHRRAVTTLPTRQKAG